LVALDKFSQRQIIRRRVVLVLVATGSRARNIDNRGNDTNTGDILLDQILFPAILRAICVDNSFQIFDAGWPPNEQAANMETKPLIISGICRFCFGRLGGGNAGETPILGVRIASVLPNPEGEDQGKGSITLTNQGTTSIDLTGWKLRDRAFGEAPLSEQLATGVSKTIILPRSLALNNNGDEVALIGSDGIERHRISYTNNQVSPGQNFISSS
jgi:hypothetical protein